MTSVDLLSRPWLGECFLWFVSFAPKEMNESFCFFSKRRLLILIHPSILFNECLEPFEHLYPLRLQLSGIQKFPLMLNPVQHIMLFDAMLRGITHIGHNKRLYLFIPSFPTLILRHNTILYSPETYHGARPF